MSFDDQLFSILNYCDKDQLNKYLNDDDAVDVLVKSMEQYQELINEKEKLEKSNKELAEANLNVEPVLEALKYKLKTAINEFHSAKSELLSLKEAFEIQQKSDGLMSLNAISTALQTRASKAEEETDKQADEFFCQMNGMLHGEEELNNFQRQFLEARTLAHIKKIKAEKMKELLKRQY